MSLVLKAILEFEPNSDLLMISDECFNFVSDACKRKIAINKILRFDECEELNQNQMLFEISNSYVFCEVEEILRDDHTVPYPSHIERLKNLQGLLETFYKPLIVKSLKVFMYTDGSRDEDLINIDCKLENFAKFMKDELYQKIDYAYQCNFTK